MKVIRMHWISWNLMKSAPFLLMVKQTWHFIALGSHILCTHAHTYFAPTNIFLILMLQETQVTSSLQLCKKAWPSAQLTRQPQATGQSQEPSGNSWPPPATGNWAKSGAFRQQLTRQPQATWQSQEPSGNSWPASWPSAKLTHQPQATGQSQEPSGNSCTDSYWQLGKVRNLQL